MFDHFKRIILSNSFLTGLYSAIYNQYVRTKYRIVVGKKVFLGLSSVFEGHNAIGERTYFTNSKIGFASYISHDCDFIDTKIGKYCSIGPYIKCIKGNHPTSRFVSTHPSFYASRTEVSLSFTEKDLFDEFQDPINPNEPYTIEIGNDVWLGADITLLDGVKIGDGAIVASGAVVTKSVEPYTIVGGVPAKPIKKRFEESDIEFLLKLNWWEKDLDWIKKHSQYFSNISDLRKALDKK